MIESFNSFKMPAEFTINDIFVTKFCDWKISSFCDSYYSFLSTLSPSALNWEWFCLPFGFSKSRKATGKAVDMAQDSESNQSGFVWVLHLLPCVTFRWIIPFPEPQFLFLWNRDHNRTSLCGLTGITWPWNEATSVKTLYRSLKWGGTPRGWWWSHDWFFCICKERAVALP